MFHEGIASCICCHDDYWFLGQVIQSCLPAGPVFVFVSTLAWNGSPGEYQRCVDVAEAAGATVVVGAWPTESFHRISALAEMKRRGFRYCLIPDGDEILEPKLLESLVQIATSGAAERVQVTMDTYWKGPDRVVRPREALTPLMLINLDEVHHVHIRHYEGGRLLTLPEEFGVLHHLSYAGPDERILRKISTWSHKHEVVPNWYKDFWHAFDTDPLIQNLHPTHPPAYRVIEHIPVPPVLANIPHVVPDPTEVPENWPKISVIIPLYGGSGDIAKCLDSLQQLNELLHEVIVVDDVSPDNAPEVVEKYPRVKLIRHETNKGFAGTCNTGYEASTGEVVLFLNSDTSIPKSAIVRLIGSLMSSGNVAAAGPLSNNTGHHQQIAVTYSTPDNMPLFADALARSEAEDEDVDMLVGFCLAAKRKVLEEVGTFDERFKVGNYDDNDLCYRLRRAGFRLVLSRSSFVHRTGTQSLNRRKEHPAVLMSRNRALFLEKWKLDLESGFASTLSGLGPERITFNEVRRPESILRQLRRQAKKANITLCMIVKDEERVLRDCLTSVKDIFSQIVLVDTGSTDRTKDIAKEFGVDLYEMEWPDSFALARNVSLSHAKGRWCMWVDADDTIGLLGAERILQSVLNAPDDVIGFVLPVRFNDGGPSGGTQVDHVKVFRNLPGVKFERRVHEQVLPSLRAIGGRIERIDAFVLHSGYDNSPEGQARKREREFRLLELDLLDEPNHPFIWFNFGMTQHYCQMQEEAIASLKRCIELSTDGESHLRKAYALLGESYRALGMVEEARETFIAGLTHFSTDPELHFRMGVSLTGFGQFEEAKAHYLAINPDISGHFSSIDRAILGYKRFHNLAQVCEQLGQIDEAHDWLRRALDEEPHFTPSAVDLYTSAMKAGKLKVAQEALGRLQAAEGPSELWAENLFKLSEAMGQDPESSLRGFLAANPYATGPLLVLAKRLLGRGDIGGAIPLLELLDRLGHPEGSYNLGVLAMRAGDFHGALELMDRSINIVWSEQAANQLDGLQRLLHDNEPLPTPVDLNTVLTGPHVGKLGGANKRASVVIVSYNSSPTIAECVQRVLATLGEDDELIIVENASSDSSSVIIQSVVADDARVRVLVNEANIGYARAVNQGLLFTQGEHLVALNPDAFVYPGWIEGLANRISPTTPIVGPVSDNVAGEQFVGTILGERRIGREEIPALLQAEQTGQSRATKFIAGLCLMVSRDFLNEHGLLDETTELGADDLELSWRAQALGFQPVIALDVFVAHQGSVSFGSLNRSEAQRRVRNSDFALVNKLEAYYGKDNIPNSRNLWGTEIFDQALLRWRLRRAFQDQLQTLPTASGEASEKS